MLLNGIDYIIKEFYNLHIIQLKCISLFLREFGSGAVLNAVLEGEKAQTISGAF